MICSEESGYGILLSIEMHLDRATEFRQPAKMHRGLSK